MIIIQSNSTTYIFSKIFSRYIRVNFWKILQLDICNILLHIVLKIIFSKTSFRKWIFTVTGLNKFQDLETSGMLDYLYEEWLLFTLAYYASSYRYFNRDDYSWQKCNLLRFCIIYLRYALENAIFVINLFHYCIENFYFYRRFILRTQNILKVQILILT